MWNARLDESQAGIKIAGRNINNLRYANNTTLMAENEGELKTLLMKVKEERVKAGLKCNIQKTKIIASGPNTLWEIRGGKKMDSDRLFISWAPKSLQIVTATMKWINIFSLKAMTNLDSKLKSRDVTLPTKIQIVKAAFFPGVMYGCFGQ